MIEPQDIPPCMGAALDELAAGHVPILVPDRNADGRMIRFTSLAPSHRVLEALLHEDCWRRAAALIDLTMDTRRLNGLPA